MNEMSSDGVTEQLHAAAALLRCAIQRPSTTAHRYTNLTDCDDFATLSAAFDLFSCPIYIADADRRILFLNSGAQNVATINPGIAIGALPESVFPNFTASELRIDTPAGSSLGIVGTLLPRGDNTAETSPELHNLGDSFQLIADAMPQIVYVTDAAGYATYVNRYWRDYTGAESNSTALRLNWSDHLFTADLQPTLDAWRLALQAGVAFQTEYRLKRGDGQYRWHLSQAQPIRDSSGRIQQWIGTSTDIHDLKSAQERLAREHSLLQEAESNARLRLAELEALYANAPVALGFADSSHRFVRLNKRLADMNGLPVAEHIGKTVMEVLPEPLAQAVTDLHRQVLNTGQAVCDIRFRGRTLAQPGADRLWEAEFHPVFTGKEQPEPPAGVSVVVHDVTEREQQKALLERSNQDLQHFAYAISHDLREPLRTITALAESVLRKWDQLSTNAGAPLTSGDTAQDEKLRWELETVVAASRRVQRLVGDMLEYSTVAHRMDLADTEPVDLNAVAAEVLGSLHTSIQEAEATVLIEGSLPVVPGHYTTWCHVVQNLVSNALKYRHAERRPMIRIAAELKNSNWELSVSDNGEGIDSRFIDKIFQPFTRLHGPEKSGTGLGLALVRRVLERHGGTVLVESEPGVGSRFVLVFPRTSN